MYCPRCGQQQISDETRFCSRCGLPISGLSEWVASGGVPAVRVEEMKVPSPSPRRRGVRRGAKLMFVGGVLLPVALVLGLIFDEPAPLILPALIFFVAITWMLYARLFGEADAPVKSRQAQTSALGPVKGGGALPPASDLRMPGVGAQQPRTAEMARPPSVTENTTRLLDNE